MTTFAIQALSSLNPLPRCAAQRHWTLHVIQACVLSLLLPLPGGSLHPLQHPPFIQCTPLSACGISHHTPCVYYAHSDVCLEHKHKQTACTATGCSLLVALLSDPSLHTRSASFPVTSCENHTVSPDVHFSQDTSNDSKLQTLPWGEPPHSSHLGRNIPLI